MCEEKHNNSSQIFYIIQTQRKRKAKSIFLGKIFCAKIFEYKFDGFDVNNFYPTYIFSHIIYDCRKDLKARFDRIGIAIKK
jgi:hypothetical protein